MGSWAETRPTHSSRRCRNSARKASIDTITLRPARTQKLKKKLGNRITRGGAEGVAKNAGGSTFEGELHVDS